MHDALAGRPQSFGPDTVLSERYRLVRRVGRGATADVFHAVDERLQRDVAVKLFHQTRDQVEQQRIHNEMRTLAALHHPALVAVFDASSVPASDWSDEVPFLVMELIHGQSVRQRLAHGPLPASEVNVLGRCVSEALAYVHARGFVHRDVKPANILIDDQPADPRFAVKLADFGIARLSGSPHLTSDGTAIGTANYLSPEQVTGSEVTAASDIYSLGLVLLECLSGHAAFPGTGVEAALARLHRDPDIPRHVSPAWRTLITQMTWRDPAARLTAVEVIERLASVSTAVEDVPDTVAIPARVQPASPDETPGHTAVLPALPVLTAPLLARRRRRGWLGAAIASVGAAIVVLMIAAASGSGGTFVPPSTTSSSVPTNNAVPITVHSTPSTSPASPKAPAPKPPARGHHHRNGNQDG